MTQPLLLVYALYPRYEALLDSLVFWAQERIAKVCRAKAQLW